MITGAHSIIYNTNPDADRDFFKNVLQLTKVDVGQGRSRSSRYPAAERSACISRAMRGRNR
jgi:hypothetical protein